MARKANKKRVTRPESARFDTTQGQAGGGKNGSIRSAVRTPLPPPLLLAGAALLVAAVGGGMLYDRVMPAPGAVGLMELLATPLAMCIVGVSLIWTFWIGRTPVASPAFLRPIYLTFGAFLAW